MQENSEDYYNLLDYGEGCCLNCPHSEPGCLCFDCKCKKCYWYSPINSGKGVCDKVAILKEEGKKRARERYIRESKKKAKIFRKEWKNKMGGKIDNKKVLIKPCEFLDQELKKEGLRNERAKRKRDRESFKWEAPKRLFDE